MTFFDELKDKAAELAQTGVAKGKELAEIGKLRLDNASQKDVIRKAYLEIGKRYYENHGHAPDPDFSAFCEKITAAMAAIECNNARIEELRTASGEDMPEEDVTVIDLSSEDEPQ